PAGRMHRGSGGVLAARGAREQAARVRRAPARRRRESSDRLAARSRPATPAPAADCRLGAPPRAWVHGVETPLELVRLMGDYTLEGRAERIACPTLVCSAERDEIGVTARRLFDALSCQKEFATFTAAEGAGAASREPVPCSTSARSTGSTGSSALLARRGGDGQPDGPVQPASPLPRV